MRDEQIALARRAVACKGWRWMPGMNSASRLDQDGAYLRLHGVGLHGAGDLELRGGSFDLRQRKDGLWLCLLGGDIIGRPSEVLPDLTDPATLGCLLALVREAWDCHGMHTRRGGTSNKQWHVRYDGSRSKQKAVGIGYSEAEALVAALEAAP